MPKNRHTSQDERDTAPKTNTFDYTSVSQDLATKLRNQASRIREKTKATVSAIIDIGNDLIAVKQHLEHGQFTEWVEAECGFSARSARLYTQAAHFAKDKTEMVSVLRPTTLYMLSAKSTPTEVVTEVMSRVEAGAVVSDTVVKAMLTKGKEKKERNDPGSPQGESLRPQAKGRGAAARCDFPGGDTLDRG
jgi:hypothetical protein